MTELGDIFAELGIAHYLHDFIDQGFDSWNTILDITESDFDALGVKLGHRRKLQRRIANARGVSSDRALTSPARNTPVEDQAQEEQKQNAVTRSDAKDAGGGLQGAKRKYRRHPKPDENAPERPPSAYVIFSNKMRDDLKGRNLSFTEIAKLVGENWQSLSPAEKEPYEQAAFADKERYNNELAEYKKTAQFREYSQYLAEFKARQANQQQVIDLEPKRPRLEPHLSTASSGTGSSVGSQHGGDTPTRRLRVESSTSVTSPWPIPESQASPQLSVQPVGQMAAPGQGSPNLASPTALPGYRESILAGNQQALPWRDGSRDEGGRPVQQHLPSIKSVGNRRLSHPGPPTTDSFITQHAHRTSQPGQTHPPPLLSSESTNQSTGSSSTNSSSYYSPRTPLEPAIDRPLAMPALYAQKSSAMHENQLPPLRPPSLSPQASVHMQRSPHDGLNLDFPTSMPPIRGFAAVSSRQGSGLEISDERLREYGSPDDHNLDPVSALLRAGEIVNRSSQGR